MGKGQKKKKPVNIVAETAETCVFTNRNAKWVSAWSSEQNSNTTAAIGWPVTEYTVL